MKTYVFKIIIDIVGITVSHVLDFIFREKKNNNRFPGVIKYELV